MNPKERRGPYFQNLHTLSEVPSFYMNIYEISKETRKYNPYTRGKCTEYFLSKKLKRWTYQPKTLNQMF